MTKEELLAQFIKGDKVNITTSSYHQSLIPAVIQETQFCPDHFSPRERLEVLKLGYIPTCKTCQFPSKFTNNKWQIYCTRECAAKDEDYIKARTIKATQGQHNRTDQEKSDTINKRKQTCQEVYGGNAPLASDQIRSKIKATMLERYGSEHALQNKDLLNKAQSSMIERYGAKTTLESDILLESVSRTMMERYGVTVPSKTTEYKEKSKKTCLKKYGVENPSQSDLIKDRKRESYQERYGVNHIFQLEEFKAQAKKTNLIKYGFENPMQSEEVKNKMKATCLERYGVENPGLLVNSSKPTKQEAFLIEWLNIIGTNYEYRNTSVLDHKLELDFYFPEHFFAVEINGLYWHSEKFKDPYYHENKFRLAQDRGIKLIQFWDFEVNQSPELVKSMISANINQNKRIYARKCMIKPVSANDTFLFLEENHLQGGIRYNANGLYYNDELLAIMVIVNNELKRYSCKKYITVVGGFSRLINSFKLSYIKSYSDNRYSDGGVYEKNGFTCTRQARPKYYYTKDFNSLEPRWRFMKKYIAHLGDINNQTEKEIMSNAGYEKIYGCGR